MPHAILFPGQGSQFVGMGADLFEARPDLVGDVADGILGFSLREICLEGPEDELTRTEHAQPALFALSYAMWEELKDRIPEPVAAAGHSLGEYTALVAAGVFTYEEGLSLVAERGRAMAAAADAEPSTMAAVIGSDLPDVEEVCAARREADGRLWVANINAPGQVVVAGSEADVAWLLEEGRDLGLRRVVPLSVAGAFHSPYMATAADRVAGALAALHPREPRFPVYANVSAAPVTGEEVVESLVRQVTAPVRFSETLEAMGAAGVDTFVHVGPGDVTAGLAKRTLRQATVVAVSSLEDVTAAAEALG
jgi:[acyl-carrier-protein] S-malonyltransferase